MRFFPYSKKDLGYRNSWLSNGFATGVPPLDKSLGHFCLSPAGSILHLSAAAPEHREAQANLAVRISLSSARRQCRVMHVNSFAGSQARQSWYRFLSAGLQETDLRYLRIVSHQWLDFTRSPCAPYGHGIFFKQKWYRLLSAGNWDMDLLVYDGHLPEHYNPKPAIASYTQCDFCRHLANLGRSLGFRSVLSGVGQVPREMVYANLQTWNAGGDNVGVQIIKNGSGVTGQVYYYRDLVGATE